MQHIEGIIHTASRATLANPKLFNEMVKNEDGSVKQGSLTMIMPEGTESRMWNNWNLHK